MSESSSVWRLSGEEYTELSDHKEPDLVRICALVLG
jgi:hypothetical protein